VHWVADVQTGQKDSVVQPIGQRWDRVFRGVGDGQHTFAVQGSKYSREHWRDMFKTDWSRQIVCAWEDPRFPSLNRPLYSGIITGADPNSDGTVTVDHVEVGAFADSRLTFLNYSDPPFILGGRSLRGQLLQTFVRMVIGPRRPLPFYFTEYDEAGNAPEIVAHSYDAMTIQEVIDTIVNADGGPDYDLRQQWSYESTLQWQVRVGNPRLTGPLLEFTVTSPKPGQIDFSSRTDGGRRATKLLAVGKGSEQDMRVGQAEVGGTSPALEMVRPFKDESDVGKLNSLALGALGTFKDDTEQPTLSVPISTAIAMGFQFGSLVRLLFEDHWWYFDGPQMFELVGYGIGNQPDMLDLKIRRI
jgi:hypothetical protein